MFNIRRNAKVKRLDLATVNQRTNMFIPLLLIVPAIIVIIVFTLIPFWTTASNAFHPLANSHKAASGAFGTGEFTKLFHNEYYKKAISNSMLYAIISLPIIMIVALIISAALSNIIRKKLRGAWQTVFFLPYVTSAIAISLAFAYILDANNGLLNSLLGIDKKWLVPRDGLTSYNGVWSMLILGVWKGIAFNVLIFTTAMLGVDKTHYKAASIDGAGPIKQFFVITLPSISRTTNFLITVGIIGAIKVFPLALYNNDPTVANINGGGTMMLYVFKLVKDGHFQAAGAASLVLVAIGIAFSIVLRNGVTYSTKLAEKWGERRVWNKIKNSI